MKTEILLKYCIESMPNLLELTPENIYKNIARVTVFKFFSKRFNEWVLIHKGVDNLFFICKKYNTEWQYYNLNYNIWDSAMIDNCDVFSLIDFIEPIHKEMPYNLKTFEWYSHGNISQFHWIIK